MKSKYTVPKLTVHGNVVEITQILGNKSSKDFLYFNGNIDADAAIAADQGSRDLLCTGSDPSNLNCKR